MVLRSILAILRFEGRRSLTAVRLLWWLLLVLFAPAIVALIRWTAADGVMTDGWPYIFYVLIPCVTCMLGVFMWATPILQAELEAQSWIYVAVRPGGVDALLVGNYVLAVVWTATAGLASLTLAMLCTQEAAAWQWWPLYAGLISLSVAAYAGVYLLIGVLFVKRGMVVAVGYTLVMELLLSFLPAVVNRITVQYRLRALWAAGLGWRQGPPGYDGPPEIFGVGPVWQHVAVLLGLALGTLLASLIVVRLKELSLSNEADI